MGSSDYFEFRPPSGKLLQGYLIDRHYTKSDLQIDTLIPLRVALIYMLEKRRALLSEQWPVVGARKRVEGVLDRELER